MVTEARDDRAERLAALPWYGDAVVRAYLHGRHFQYGLDFVELILESHRAYVGGNLRASIIVAGEALLRTLYSRIAMLLQNGLVTLQRGRRTITVESSSMHDLYEHLTFHQAQQILEGHLDPTVYQKVDAVRFLRSQAAHSYLPLLDEWDPGIAASSRPGTSRRPGVSDGACGRHSSKTPLAAPTAVGARSGGAAVRSWERRPNPYAAPGRRSDPDGFLRFVATEVLSAGVSHYGWMSSSASRSINSPSWNVPSRPRS
jgi:hypothetical protein